MTSKNGVLFRFPGEGDVCNVINCGADDISMVYDYKDVGKDTGFVFAPFQITDKAPILLFPTDNRRMATLDELIVAYDINVKSERNDVADVSIEDIKFDREVYSSDFKFFHGATCDGSLRKVVLARTASMTTKEKINPMKTFIKACKDYPSAFVALVWSEMVGCWVMSTPEVLLERKGNTLHTMALAGTMPFKNYDVLDVEWSKKNIDEQAFVSLYIRDVLEKYSDSIVEEGPTTVKAGDVVHLRTDFRFAADSMQCLIGSIVVDLHPTPAVCGLPVDKALRLILDNEHTEREYYSGFCGMIEEGGDFRLFVTLRCMKIEGDMLRLFAGGGIMPDSKEEDEWQETSLKMQTMKNCMNY